MVRLADADIRTREVLDWQGVHLLHAPGSSCSQKTRIVLGLKNVPWTSHLIDLKTSQNHTEWYLGINPRGLVPCLVHDGDVHIESNDIIVYLDDAFPAPRLIPDDCDETVHKKLDIEDRLHRDLRVLTFRYVISRPDGVFKGRDVLRRLRNHRGTIGGRIDPTIAGEIQFWEEANDYGISDARVIRAAEAFHQALTELEADLKETAFCIGDFLSVVDIAWFVYATRLQAAGYPLLALYPTVGAWYQELVSREAFRQEVVMPPALQKAAYELQEMQRREGRDIGSLMGWA